MLFSSWTTRAPPNHLLLIHHIPPWQSPELLVQIPLEDKFDATELAARKGAVHPVRRSATDNLRVRFIWREKEWSHGATFYRASAWTSRPQKRGFGQRALQIWTSSAVKTTAGVSFQSSNTPAIFCCNMTTSVLICLIVCLWISPDFFVR